jgi:hypothetical protein
MREVPVTVIEIYQIKQNCVFSSHFLSKLKGGTFVMVPVTFIAIETKQNWVLATFLVNILNQIAK